MRVSNLIHPRREADHVPRRQPRLPSRFPRRSPIRSRVSIERSPAGERTGDWKPMKTVGAGVREIRVREASGAFRVIYLATLPDRVLVLHAFRKKTQATPRKDIDLAARRLREWKG
ncbi:MAG: type II toxin-antitoxin system RelE/ParE family toxin [Novosphingobium sp.]|nr:type II toxin-antitoxin system RelE/ParE family toxin [Novosphingobium sp.]